MTPSPIPTLLYPLNLVSPSPIPTPLYPLNLVYSLLYLPLSIPSIWCILSFTYPSLSPLSGAGSFLYLPPTPLKASSGVSFPIRNTYPSLVLYMVSPLLCLPTYPSLALYLVSPSPIPAPLYPLYLMSLLLYLPPYPSLALYLVSSDKKFSI